MRILIIGFVAFCLWAWFASYVYMQKIIGEKPAVRTEQTKTTKENDSIQMENLTVRDTTVKETETIPD